MASEPVDTLDAILAGLQTLGKDAEAVTDEPLRQRLTGAVAGLRAAVAAARIEVLQMEEQHEQARAQFHQPGGVAPSSVRGKPPRLKWGCYQFDDTEGLFCTQCYDRRNRRVRLMRYNSRNLVCPNCRTVYPVD